MRFCAIFSQRRTERSIPAIKISKNPLGPIVTIYVLFFLVLLSFTIKKLLQKLCPKCGLKSRFGNGGGGGKTYVGEFFKNNFLNKTCFLYMS